MKFIIERLKAGWFFASITNNDTRAVFEASDLYKDDFPKDFLIFLEEILRSEEGTSYIIVDHEEGDYAIKIDKSKSPVRCSVNVYYQVDKEVSFDDESSFREVKTFPALTQKEFCEFVGTVIEEFKFYIPEAGKADYFSEWKGNFPYSELFKLVDTNRRALNAAL